MTLNSSPTELTTAATDVIIAFECIVILVYLWRTPGRERWKIGLWCWVFGLMAFVSMLGAVAHGIQIVGLATLGLGLRIGLNADAARDQGTK